MSSVQPEIVVGIDFGMTFTGVAFSNMTMPQPKVIQRWPGRPASELNRKVPTVLHYSANMLPSTPEWGFLCQYAEGKQEWFKRFLDPEYLDFLRSAEPDAVIPTTLEVRKWYRDYMQCLYTYISKYLQDHMGHWDTRRVEFLFSLPTTFRSQNISNILKGLLREAGFGQGSHTIEFGLTESQASAVDAAKYSSKNFQAGEMMLAVDAGGGTTDFALLEQTSMPGTDPELQERATIPGIDIGSTNIDTAFGKMVDERLARGGLGLDENVSWTMMHSEEFQLWKCSFGDNETRTVPRFGVTVPLLDEGVSNRQAGIERGKMMFSHADFATLFDPQVREILSTIRRQLDHMTQSLPGKYVNYLILSGGLGSSPYLLSQLRNDFELNPHPSAPSIEILLSDEPQLAVCKGVVIDRMQKIKTRRNVLVGRICPASYGVLCDMPYNKDNLHHINQDTYKDPLNGKLYVKNQVKWMIKKGQTINVDNPISHTFVKIVCNTKKAATYDENSRVWMNRIIISHEDAKNLPSSVNHAHCYVLCEVTSDFSTVSLSEFDLQKEHVSWYKKIAPRDKFRFAEHQIKVIIGPTDIKFELWFKGTQYTNFNSIRVEWQEGALISAPNENRRLDGNILYGIRKRGAIASQREKHRAADHIRNGLRSPAWMGRRQR